MKTQKTLCAWAMLFGAVFAACESEPLADVDDDDGASVTCTSTPECLDQGCVGLWRKQCVVNGDSCVPAVDGMNPEKCFRAECYCGPDCAWDGEQCSAYGGCPAYPPPTNPIAATPGGSR